jgi:Flp pilus assembly protein CpaB
MRVVAIVGAVVIAGVVAYYIKSKIDGEKADAQRQIEQAKLQSQLLIDKSRAKNKDKPKDQVIELEEVWVSTKFIPFGATLSVGDFEKLPWPHKKVKQGKGMKTIDLGYYKGDISKISGFVVKVDIAKGEPLMLDKVIDPQGSGNLAAILDPDKKAYPIRVAGDATELSQHFQPGDKVDIVLIQEVEIPNPNIRGRPIKQHIGETIFKNIKILALGSQKPVVQPGGRPAGPMGRFSTVVAEVTPEIVRKVTIAEKLGSLHMVLNPLKDSSDDDEAVVVASGDEAVFTRKQKIILSEFVKENPSFTGFQFLDNGDTTHSSEVSSVQNFIDGMSMQSQMNMPAIIKIFRVGQGWEETDGPTNQKLAR